MDRILIKIGKSYLFVKTQEIDCIEAERNYLRIYTGDSSYLIRRTMSSIETALDKDLFIRVNRSTIVNIDRIKELRSVKNYNYKVILENNKSWTWGRKFRKNLSKIVNC